MAKTAKPNSHKPDRELIERVMLAGRENSTQALLFQQAVGQALGLSATDMKCLDVIVRKGPASPTQLAELTGLTTGAVTILIDRLEKAKLIRREPDPGDRRRTLLVPTKECGKKVGPMYESMGKAMGEVLQGYTRDQLEFLEKFFGEVTAVWHRERAKLPRSEG